LTLKAVMDVDLSTIYPTFFEAQGHFGLPTQA
jgi:hypothetical protein